MLPVIRYQLDLDLNTIPWEDLDKQFAHAPEQHDLELGDARSTWDWTQQHRTDLDPWFKPVKDQIEHLVHTHTGTEEPYEKWVMNTWMNRHYTTGWTKEHKHNQCDLVFSCYLSVPENSGAFLLKWQDQWWRIPVESGDMLCFPGELDHATEVNNNSDNSPRIVLTVNASPTGQLLNAIPQPEELLIAGNTMPQTLGYIREKYLEAHSTFVERKASLISRFSQTSNIVPEPGHYTEV